MPEPVQAEHGSRPRLSVVIPAYRGTAHLGDALASLCAQTKPGVEVIVVDDGSGDGTPALARQFAGRLDLRVLEEPHCGNWVRQTNRGLAEARGEWLSILHQDDRWRPRRAEAIEAAAGDRAAEGIRFILGPAVFMDASGRPRGRWRCPLPAGRPLAPARVLPLLAVQNFIAAPAPVFHCSLRDQVGGLNEDLWYFADWDYWLRAAAAGPCLYLSEPLVEFRVHPGSQTSRRTGDLAEIDRQFSVVLDRAVSAMAALCPPVAPDPELLAFARRAYGRLTAGMHGRRSELARFAWDLLRLGPRRAWRYLYASRLAERAWPRIRAGREGEKKVEGGRG